MSMHANNTVQEEREEKKTPIIALVLSLSRFFHLFCDFLLRYPILSIKEIFSKSIK